MKIVLLALLVCSVAACSGLDVAKTALGMSTGNGPSLEVDTTVGDKEESVVGRVGDSTEIASESITGGINTTNVQDIPPWVMLLLILGWLLPSPTEMYREIKSWFSRSKR